MFVKVINNTIENWYNSGEIWEVQGEVCKTFDNQDSYYLVNSQYNKDYKNDVTLRVGDFTNVCILKKDCQICFGVKKRRLLKKRKEILII